MKILIVHPHIFGGGAEHQVLYLADYLQKNHDVSVVTLSLQENLPEFAKRLNFVLPKTPIIDPRAERGLPTYIYYGNTALKLRSLVKSELGNYDVLNPHNFPASFACMKQSNKKVVWYSQGDSPRFFGRKFENRQNFFFNGLKDCLLYTEKLLVQKYIDKICTVSKLAARIVEKRYRKPTNVVYPAVDYEFYSKGNPQIPLVKYELDGSFVILQVARITPQKNQMGIIMALEKLVKLIPNIKFIIAGGGEGPYSNELKNYIKLKKLERYVTFTGYIQSEHVRDLYQACNVNILPAYLDSFGLTPIEGLCASKIPIVSPSCGVAEFLLEHEIGKVSGDLVSAIKEIYENFEIYQEMASRGKKVIKELLSRDAFGKHMETIFLKYERK